MGRRLLVHVSTIVWLHDHWLGIGPFVGSSLSCCTSKPPHFTVLYTTWTVTGGPYPAVLRSSDGQYTVLVYRLTTRTDWPTPTYCMLNAYYAPIKLKTRSRSWFTNCDFTRFLSHVVHTRILNPALVPVVLRTVRATLFPNNGMGPPRQIPTEDETKEIKRRCAASILGLLPPKVAVTFLASDSKATQHRQVEEILECLEDSYLNKHLIFQILELIVLRLAPEMGQQGIRQLIQERIGS